MTKEFDIPVSIIVQLVVPEIGANTAFTPKEIEFLIEEIIPSHRYPILHLDSIRRSLDHDMACIERLENGPKLVKMRQKEDYEECCAECSRQKNGNMGCAIIDPFIKNYYFPEEEMLGDGGGSV